MNRRLTRLQWQARLRQQGGRKPLASSAAAGTARQRPQRAREIALRIGELRLQSFSHSEGRHIADALQQELASLLASRGVPDTWLDRGYFETAKLNDLRISAVRRPGTIGEKLAGALMQIGEPRGRA
jgi:hypothetical protein